MLALAMLQGGCWMCGGGWMGGWMIFTWIVLLVVIVALVWMITTRSRRLPVQAPSGARRSSCALMATITVLADMRIAAIAGESTMPRDASTPAASGMATML